MGGIDPILLLASLMVASTPILLAAMGEMICERSGVLNLGVEGMMITGAVCGFAVTVASGSPWVGFLGAAAAGAVLALIFGVLTQYLLSNQVATGLALTLFGLGLSALIGQSYAGITIERPASLWLPVLRDIPWLGPILFRHDIVLYLSLGMVVVLWWFLTRSRGGLILRAVGENHDAAHALGYPVVAIRLAAITFGGAMAGAGGAYISIMRLRQWTEGMTSGAGWIALAIVVFGSWRSGRVLLGAYLFGGVTVLQLNLQGAGFKIPTVLLSASPYLITILVLVLMSLSRNARNATPGNLGVTFHASN